MSALRERIGRPSGRQTRPSGRTGGPCLSGIPAKGTDTGIPAIGDEVLTELTTIAAAATTDTVIQIPANCIVTQVAVFVTVAIPTAVTFNYGIAGATARYGTGISTSLNAFYPGTDDGPRLYTSAISIRFTPNTTPGAATGRVQTTIHYNRLKTT